jgi:hypothetical protein
VDDLAGDVTRPRGAEKRHKGGDVGGGPWPLDESLVDEALPPLTGKGECVPGRGRKQISGRLCRRDRARVGPGTAGHPDRVDRCHHEDLAGRAVTRRRSGEDGRHSYVTLTAAGHALIERGVDDLLRHEDSLLSALMSEQRDELAILLRVLLSSLA